MTALAGTWRFGDTAESDRRCLAMLSAQRRHGIGESRTWAGPGISLGRRLTPTLPEDRHDRGVEHDRAGASRMVADIRIDNRDELASLLGVGSAEAPGLSDSCLLMLAWQRWRETALRRLVGDFAFALWDGERLILARDFPGQRPLFYWQARGQIAFASMPCGLLALEELAPAADERSLERFARFARLESAATHFQGIRRVMPGEMVVFTPDATTRAAHWTPPVRQIVFARDEDYVEAVRETLDLAVAARMRGGENGIACHLSAGLDSTAVATTAARLHTARRPISALTVVPQGGHARAADDRLADERHLAAATASLYESIEHVVVERADRSPIEHFETGLDLFQRPVSEVVNQDLYIAANEAARDRGAAVLLHGQAGNLTFSHGGMDLLAGLLARGRIDLWWHEYRAGAAAGNSRRAMAMRSLAPFMPRPLWLMNMIWRGRPIRLADHSLVRGGAASIGPYGSRRPGEVDYALQPRSDSARWRVEALAGVDVGSLNKGHLAGWGIDLRDPTADRRMIELTLAIPASQYDRAGVARSLARRVLAGRVPAELLAEARRGYQSADWFDYLTTHRRDIAAEAERQFRSEAARFLDTGRMRSLIESWPASSHDAVARRLYRGALMTALSAGHFARRVGQFGVPSANRPAP